VSEKFNALAASEALSAKGVCFTSVPTPLPECKGIIAFAFCYDPSGNVVELIELAPGFQQKDLDASLDSRQQG
jgi:hypothetical protein